MKTYVVVGGGSGGHLTPLLAVATALKLRDPGCRVIFIGQKSEDLSEALEGDAVDETHLISAGKFRRYHGESILAHLLDVKTLALNIRDLFRFAWGTIEAWRLLGRVRPDCIFLKGGFVSVPVGFAARSKSIPYLTHDSDAVPGLANRLTAKNAVYNTTALPIDHYPYPPAKTRMVGIPLRPEFALVSDQEKASFKKELDIDAKSPVLFCIGGGQGARKLNEIIVAATPELFKEFLGLRILHVTGKKLFRETKMLYEDVLGAEAMLKVHLIDFSNEIYRFSGAADVVITRGGATNLAEFAIQAKPCIVVPNPVLTGGQQLHNARILEENNAAIIVEEGDRDGLSGSVRDLLRSSDQRSQYGERMHTLAVDHAADKIAELLEGASEVRV